MRRLLPVAFAALLGGCAGTPEDPFALFPVYRDRDAPIGAIASFAPDRYLGLWHEVARYPVPFETGCRGVTAEYTARADGLIGVRNICRNAEGAVVSSITGTAEVVGPGRLKVRFGAVPFVAADYWVLWVDEGYRTAVVGTPNGRAGWILNRDPRIPRDRLAAAKEILDFNGYDLERLEVLQ